MGGKRFGRGKPIYLCLAFLMFLGPVACALNGTMSPIMVDTTGQEALAHLALGRELLARGDYGNALKENEKVLSLAGRNIPVDEALFYVGLIQAHPLNPARNQGKSLVIFKRLVKEYPQSALRETAKALVELLQENDSLSRKAAGLVQENENLNRKAERLNTLIQELKKIDIDVDQKKREQIK